MEEVIMDYFGNPLKVNKIIVFTTIPLLDRRLGEGYEARSLWDLGVNHETLTRSTHILGQIYYKKEILVEVIGFIDVLQQ